MRAGHPETGARQGFLVDVLHDALGGLVAADPAALRKKFRKMAAEPFAFYRGSAWLFYADVAALEDPFSNEQTSRVWIQGDLHAQNYGTYMNDRGRLVFDVNDFDESYVGAFTWDTSRMAASLYLLGVQKALADDDIDEMVTTYARSYAEQVCRFVNDENDKDFALRLDTTSGALHAVLQAGRQGSRTALLEANTVIDGYERVFRDGSGVRRLDAGERSAIEAAFRSYLQTIPEEKRRPVDSYRVKDVVGRSGFGIGSAGLPAYNILLEGATEALENDVILSMKQANVAAPSRVVTDPEIAGYFAHHGHRTVLSQRALQAHADPWLGHTEVGGVGYVVAELSPYEADLDWDELSDDDLLPVLTSLGQATAKAHCVADDTADTTLVPFCTEEAIAAAIDAAGGVDEFAGQMRDVGRAYGEIARADYPLFVDAFRNGAIPGL
ncbi:DUF2252 domain-containing protein [Motilibacter deserti]|uniref:DUF2252 domain-containing protein n=1 Tax=Motilibacter deserti TaxID=2714956 RepID=A0ABX0GWV8_9ACTN|nr:DUF2252 domain-containing protein [Motilibacter deserti]NHC14176.1 DUF2252 domain-containing protein [Motilibacter deserti]